jgi:hypothetical protein
LINIVEFWLTFLLKVRFNKFKFYYIYIYIKTLKAPKANLIAKYATKTHWIGVILILYNVDY